MLNNSEIFSVHKVITNKLYLHYEQILTLIRLNLILKITENFLRIAIFLVNLLMTDYSQIRIMWCYGIQLIRVKTVNSLLRANLLLVYKVE